ncbi:MAG TPA: hypothetical protein VF279_04970, partial [Acidimicrobiales bacterium]
MPGTDVTSPGPPGVGSGCLASVVLGVVYIIGEVLFIMAPVVAEAPALRHAEVERPSRASMS